jgi:hypothetical protein
LEFFGAREAHAFAGTEPRTLFEERAKESPPGKPAAYLSSSKHVAGRKAAVDALT